MKTRALILLLSLLLSAPLSVQSADPWQPVGDGIDYQEFHTAEPNDIFVARMDRSTPSAILDSAIAEGRISHATERVSQIFKRYDDAINFWGGSWGPRNQVVVAINGSYFNNIGAPESGQIASGWYAKRFSDLGGGSGLGYRMDRSVFIGQCVFHAPQKQSVAIQRAGQAVTDLRIDGLNIPRGADQLILYTPQYDDYTHTNANGLEVRIEMTRPTLVLPYPNGARGVVRQILNGQGQTLIPFDHIVLSASGSARERLLANLRLEDEILISQEISPLDKDCVGPYDQPWAKTYASIGGAGNILRDGQIIPSTEQGGIVRAPRTAMAYNDRYIFFIVVDGRNPKRSVGMTFDGLAEFARTTLGARWAVVQDGGGSSVMVVNGQVKNHPVSACNVTYLPLVISPALEGPPSPFPTPVAPSSDDVFLFSCERKVANAMLMINVQPAAWSRALRPFDLVSVASPSEIRLGPGSNYPGFASAAAGSVGYVVPHAANLNGIAARGTHWWKVSFGRATGWVDEQALRYQGTLPLNYPTAPALQPEP